MIDLKKASVRVVAQPAPWVGSRRVYRLVIKLIPCDERTVFSLLYVMVRGVAMGAGCRFFIDRYEPHLNEVAYRMCSRLRFYCRYDSVDPVVDLRERWGIHAVKKVKTSIRVRMAAQLPRHDIRRPRTVPYPLMRCFSDTVTEEAHVEQGDFSL